MKIGSLSKYGFVYVATPYTRYETGLGAAAIDAARLMADLIRAGVFNAHSPIVEAHQIAYHGGLNQIDLKIWHPFCAARIAQSDALVVGMLKGWERSEGTLGEIKTFIRSGKPVHFLDPVRWTLEDPTREELQTFAGAAA